MSATVTRGREPFLALPGFMPDAVGYAARTVAALLLAYLLAFTIQLQSASSAGLCVAIVSQASPGMALSKAAYRALGTMLGGAVAVALVGLFPQDRTMLLLAFTLWLGACTFVATVLRDFRSYGAVLCGYTVGIIAVTGIDAPEGALLAALDRVAAILLGIASVAVVNALLFRAVAFEGLAAELQRRLAAAEALAAAALAGRPLPAEPLPAQEGAAVLALRTEAIYAGNEMADGRVRRGGAEAAIAGLLGMLSATRALETGLRQPTDPDTRRVLDAAAGRLRHPDASPLDLGNPQDPQAAALLDRADELLAQHALVRAGLHRLMGGVGPATPVRLPMYRDWIGATLGAGRTMIAVGLGAAFCIESGLPGTTGLLVQQAAFTALLGMQPNPTAAALPFCVSLPVAAAAAWVIGFVLLPQAAGFVPFALALAPFAFAAALAARHPATARFGPSLLLYLTLLLAPANTQSFDLSAFLNNVLVQAVAVLFMVLTFQLLLPVSPRRRLLRVAGAVGRQVRRSAEGGRTRHDPVSARCLRFDWLAQAQVWLGRPTPVRLAVLTRLSAFTELDSALRRARAGLAALGLPMPPCTPGAMDDAARGVLAAGWAGPQRRWALAAAAGLHGAAVLLRQHGRALRRYGILAG